MKKNLLGSRYESTIKPEIGNKYHLSWANYKCVWVLTELCKGGVYCRMETPKTRKPILAKVKDLRLLSKDPAHKNNYKPN